MAAPRQQGPADVALMAFASTHRFCADFCSLLACCRCVRFVFRTRRRRSQNSCGSSLFLACNGDGTKNVTISYAVTCLT